MAAPCGLISAISLCCLISLIQQAGHEMSRADLLGSQAVGHALGLGVGTPGGEAAAGLGVDGAGDLAPDDLLARVPGLQRGLRAGGEEEIGRAHL